MNTPTNGLPVSSQSQIAILLLAAITLQPGSPPLADGPVLPFGEGKRYSLAP